MGWGRGLPSTGRRGGAYLALADGRGGGGAYLALQMGRGWGLPRTGRWGGVGAGPGAGPGPISQGQMGGVGAGPTSHWQMRGWGRGLPQHWQAGRGGAYLALAEGGAVVDLVAAGALAQGLAATVHTGLLQEDRVSVVGTPPRETEGGRVTGTRLTRISCPRLTDSEQEAGGWITYRPTSLQTAGISFPPSMQKANWKGQHSQAFRASP